jgi:hypothetical protein
MRGKLNARHLVFAGLFVLIATAMVSGIRLETRVSSQTKRMYEYIDNLPRGSVLLVSFDHEASSLPEIRPIALALLRHAFERDHKVIGMALLAEGTAIGYRLLEEVAREYDAEYGEDYAYLGFKPQYIAAILSLGESMSSTFPLDYLDFPYGRHPVLQKIERYDDVAAVMSIADGSLTTHWMEYAGSRYNVTVLGGVTAAMVTTYDPYLASGQMHAMIGGLRGAAEYESLLGKDGGGARGMLAQSTAHLYVILLIIIGNVVYYFSGRKRRA